MTETLLSTVVAAAATPVSPALDAAAAAAALNLPAASAEALAAARAEGVAEGTKAASARIGAILGHSEAAGRDALARHIAFNTDLSPEAAGALLAASAKAVAPTTTGRLDALVPDPKIGAGTEASAEEAIEAGLSAAVDKMIKNLG